MKAAEPDAAASAMHTFAKATGNSTLHVQRLREQAIYRDGALSGKVKVLAALLWSVNSRCEPCIRYYAAKAREFGASEVEIAEMLGIAPAMGACVAETWALKAVRGAPEQEENCCD